MISSALRFAQAQWDAVGIALAKAIMATTHITIPKTPPIEVIEAMIEASIDSKHNVEAIYKAIIAYYETRHIQLTKDLAGDQIATVSVTVSTNTIQNTKAVLLEVAVGAERKQATGLLSIDTALQLSESLFEKAIEASGI